MRMIQLFLALICILQGAVAQTNQTVVPSGLDSQAGNRPDGILETGGHFQELFRASSLAVEWHTPVLITGVAFRVSQQPGSYSAVVPNIEIRFSTSSRTPEQMSLLYDVNKGADESIVYSHNDVSLFGAAGQTPNPFDLKFAFDQPFVYDPSAGHLLMYMTARAASGGGRSIDAQAIGGLGTSPAAYVGSTGPFADGQVVAYSPVMQFSWVSVPEPSAQLLFFAIIFIGLPFLRNRR